MISMSGKMTSSYTNLLLLNNNNTNKSTWRRLRETLPQEVNKAQVIVLPAGALKYCQNRHLKVNLKSRTKLKKALAHRGLTSDLEDGPALLCPVMRPCKTDE